MARRYRKIDPRTWDDEGFQKLPAVAKLVALYCVTGQSNRCGIFVYSHGRALEHTSVNQESYAIAFAKVLDTLKWSYHEASRVLYIPTWWRYNPPENPKHLSGCLSDIHDLPATPLLREFYRNTKDLPAWAEKMMKDSYRIAIRIARPYQEQEQEQNKVSPSSSTKKVRTEPPQAATSEPPAFPVFPVRGREKAWTLADPLARRLSETFPGLDVILEARKAHLWATTHPNERKTANGMPAFLGRWMDRAANGQRAPAANGHPANKSPAERRREEQDRAIEEIGR